MPKTEDDGLTVHKSDGTRKGKFHTRVVLAKILLLEFVLCNCNENGRLKVGLLISLQPVSLPMLINWS